MSNIYTKDELFKMDAIEVYKLVLEKKYIKTFPKGFWQRPEAVDNAIKCTKYLIEDILKLNQKELTKQLSVDIFNKNSLSGMLRCCFNNSPYEIINLAYPEMVYKPWEFNKVPRGYWDDINNGVNATKWLIETKLQLNEEELKQRLSAKLFQENGLGSMLQYCFEGSPYEAINTTYPERNYMPWNFNHSSNGYWSDINNGILATEWLINTKLKLSDEELKEKLSANLFRDNGLSGMLCTCFNGSPFEAINKTFPNKNYKKEDFKNYK